MEDFTEDQRNFVKRATRITSFNLTSADFTTDRYKYQIQLLYKQHMFKSFDPDEALTRLDSNTDIATYNRLIEKLKADDKYQFEKLHSLPIRGVGPGEATLYLLTKNSNLGGGSSAGVDIVISGTGYEVKAVTVSNGIAFDFKLGGTVPLADIMNRLDKLRMKTNAGGSKTEMAKASVIPLMRNKGAAEFKAIEEDFAQMAAKYFAGHKTIFINNTRANLGRIEAIKTIEASNIMIERVTSGTVKPMVKL